MPEPDEPTPDELPEIGRRLCGLLGVEPEEPVSASALRAIANDRSSGVPKARWTVILAVRICADAMAVHELPAEIRELRNAIDAYARYMLQSQEVRQRLAVALQKAIPSLEREAATRFKSRAPDGGEHAEAAGQSSTWPSPEALVDLPRKLLDLVPQEFGMVGRMRQVLHDLSRVDGDPRIVPRFAPTNIRMAKALDLAGYSAAEIATIIKPFAKTGTARKQARNTVLRYLTSKSEDMLLAWSIPPDAPDRAQRVKELEEALDRVMGMADAKVRRVAVGSAPDAAPDSVPSSSR